MKKFLMLASAMFAFATVASAQTFQKGDNLASAAVGFGGDYGVPITLNYERGVWDINSDMCVGVGGVLGWSTESEKDNDNKYRNSDVFLGARSNWHYTGVEKLDLYAGLTLGVDFWSGKAKSHSGGVTHKSSDNDLFLGAQIGARYFFVDNWAVNMEFGYGIAVCNIGATLKF